MSGLACVNGRNSRLISARVIPMPLSATVKTSFTCPRDVRVECTSSCTPPRSVNFTALSIRFSSAARNRTASPTSNSGRSPATVTSAPSSLVSARALRASVRSSTRRRGRNGCCCSTSPPASDLAASITNVVSDARCSALVLMPMAQRRSRSPRPELASNSPSARMPVSAVRISCANAASAASVARAALAEARLAAARRLCGRLFAKPRSVP